ncbi:alpha/beta hydrolase [Flexibacterium corallicola]|uniref:alpha/beta hydrolase n=1 Tax=Flexibacterium corallicola TaxID=3037259 RepID=UPI00286F0A23|nr:alpha/beta hydrolase [Pseudovibrio sp. M1P-2-3]
MGNYTSIKDWDTAYSNSRAVPEAHQIFQSWAALSERYRQEMPCELDIAYGGGQRERFDIFHSANKPPKGLVVYVHGGYWKAFDKNSSSFIAGGLNSHGYSVAVPSYSLCPQVSISDIRNQIAKSIECAAERIDGPIILSGHSAGAQLVARMICADTQLPDYILGRIQNVVGISGVYDLRPIINTSMNQELLIDEKEARVESPSLKDPASGKKMACWVGAQELPEFLKQSRDLYRSWKNSDCHIQYQEAQFQNHFTVLSDMTEAASPLVRAHLTEL